jgi:hypothetical protein
MQKESHHHVSSKYFITSSVSIRMGCTAILPPKWFGIVGPSYAWMYFCFYLVPNYTASAAERCWDHIFSRYEMPHCFLLWFASA